MSDMDAPVDGAEVEEKKGSGLKAILVGLVLAAILGAGGFYAIYSGMVLGSDGGDAAAPADNATEGTELGPVAFVPLEPLVISIGSAARNRHLRFRAELEVAPGTESEVTKLSPRIVDVLNSYLRAVEVRDLEDASALITLRAQMLRRIQLVAGPGRVRDLLIMEFVLN